MHWPRCLPRTQPKLDQLFDELVKIRHKIALALGYDNFLDLGYARRGRVGITPNMIKTFRDQVHQHVVPIVQNLRQRQAERLGLSSLTHYDEGLNFVTGNARPKGSSEDILDSAGKMFTEMSPETDMYFKFLKEHDLLDVLNRDNKFQMVYCEFVAKYKLPLVFANFNGTADDVDSITHEAGHGFQFYCSRDYELPEYYEAPSDISEVHSMSMELFAWPWLDLFFGDETDKYKFSYLDKSLKKITLFTIADEFQEWVYTNPEAAPQERTKIWREIERKYWPHRDYDDNEFLDQGGYWYRYGNIFQEPLYMIDYALAQFAAYQFFARAQDDWQGAWNDYVKLCKAGGSDSFTNLLNIANLKSPFQEGSFEAAIRPIQDWLVKVDDTNF